MRISYKVWLVGGIPIVIAAAIAVAAWLLLNEAERARDGAVGAGTVYRNLLVAMKARDDYLQALPGDRSAHANRFASLSNTTRNDLRALRGFARDEAHGEAVAGARDSLLRYVERMNQFIEVTTRNDFLVAEMGGRVTALISLTDRARARQHAFNADIVASLADKDKKLRSVREIVDRAHELQVQIGAVARDEIARDSAKATRIEAAAEERLQFALAKLRNAVRDLSVFLRSGEGSQSSDELLALLTAYERGLAEPAPVAADDAMPPPRPAAQRLAAWSDRLLKVNVTEQRSLQEEVAQLLTYSVESNETDQATQNIATESLKLGQRTADALRKRDPGAAAAIVTESEELSRSIDALPISPLIQTEMAAALEQWRERLTTTMEGLREQNAIIADMDVTATGMVESARSLNDMFTAEGDRIGGFVRKILMIGATIGLLLGSGAAFIVARSITEPLQRLQRSMRELARNPLAGPIPSSARRDELGDMERAANFFVTEIGSREQALRIAKERADEALDELRQTQANLIQSEKLASLGQLVAGVAHEINTPVGIALTTATTLHEEVRQFEELTASGQVSRSRFTQFVERMKEGSHLLFANLTRAGELVHSFKQVAADQVSSERRSFELAGWVQDLLTSLRPVLRKAGHEVTVTCEPDLLVDTYPGALAQVLTNLVMNALVHGYPPQMAGTLSIVIGRTRSDMIRIVFSDDGRGMAADVRNKAFDPFFTTARNRGSTGLGLHIVYNLVTSKLQGRIDMASRPGHGTTFTITFPTRVIENTPELAAVSA